MKPTDTTPTSDADLSDPLAYSMPGLRARVIARLLSLGSGSLLVRLPDGSLLRVRGADDGPDGAIHIARWRALWRLVSGGHIGFAEGFMEGDWASPDLTSFLRVAARNAASLHGAMRGSLAKRGVERLRHLLRANTKIGSRRNIAAHYDLGNEFYALWLDTSLSYSSALFGAGHPTLEVAQQAKLQRVTELLSLSGGETVLEIGCGWGALAAHLAHAAGAQVTGITLSPSQLAKAREIVATRGLSDKVSIELRDYRDVGRVYDRIVSIEMFEAVGEAWWPAYFGVIERSLAANGRAVLQVISIAEDRYDAYRSEPDFIQKHIFPGGFLPSISAFTQAADRAGLALAAAERFGASYAETLAQWRRRFDAAWPDIAKLGFDDRFRRMWDYYLSYCEAGFREGVVDVGLYTLVKKSA